jgi:uncharacterized protein YbjT (DUF2867 family)
MTDRPVLVTGATGYVGGRLIPELLRAGHQVRCLARTPSKLDGRPWRDQVEVARGDLSDEDKLAPALDGCGAAYYLVHAMGSHRDFAEAEERQAATFARIAEETGLTQIVYLGGLGEDDDELSPHLRSRHEVGRVLGSGRVPVTELRAAVIIGSGSASFEMLRSLTEVLPIMVAPRWVTQTWCQPIAIRDVLDALVDVLGRPDAMGRIIELGGPDVVTYRDLMQLYADAAGLRRRIIIPVPLLTPGLSSHWVNLVTPLPRSIARPLIEGLRNDVVVSDPDAREAAQRRLPMRDAMQLALTRIQGREVSTRWAGADLRRRAAAVPQGDDPSWAGGSLLVDEHVVETDAPADDVMRAVVGIGGERGWPAADALWEVRGFLDKLFGGVGLRRGRRHPAELIAGDALDFWRVEEITASSLRLRAEMRLPGHAWLEWEVEPGDSAGRCVLRQRASFAPRGLWGRAYWYAMWPFHALIFGRMARRIAAVAHAARPDSDGPPATPTAGAAPRRSHG